MSSFGALLARALRVALVLLPFCPLGGAQVGHAADDKPQHGLRVLFIGNSFTYSTNMAGIVSGIAQSKKDGPGIEYQLIVHSGATLRSHLQNGRAAAALKQGHWDYVVLQEQGSLGGDIDAEKPVLASPEQFYSAVRELVPQIRAVGAKPVLMMTWARNLQRRERVAQQAKLTEAYQAIGKELAVPIAPIGLAWEEAFRLMPSLILHASDDAHPSQAGGYLGACVLYSVLTGRSAEGAATTIFGNPVTVGADKQVLPDSHETVPLAELGPAMGAEFQKIAWKIGSAK
jgi:hypothetical protein